VPHTGVVFAGAIAGGFLLGLIPVLTLPVPSDLVTALLAGAIITATIQQSLGTERRFGPLFAGAILEGALLVILLG
jgi:TctA family transporter